MCDISLEEDKLFFTVFGLRDRISSTQKWMADYESKRANYPFWITRKGKYLKVENITNGHLRNLLRFVPENNTWHQVFECEILYRKYQKQLPYLKEQLSKYEEIIDKVF